MRTSVGRGRVYRRCGCRDIQHYQLGARCPRLATDSDHGTWSFAVDLPAPDHRRTTVRRGGFTSQDSAEQALGRFLEGEAGGYNADPNQSVATYLNAWLAAKALVLKPTTMARYRDYVRNDLIPAFGTLKLDQLAHRLNLRPLDPHCACRAPAGSGTGPQLVPNQPSRRGVSRAPAGGRRPEFGVHRTRLTEPLGRPLKAG